VFDLSDGQKGTRAWARDFAEREVAPRAAAMDAAGEFPRDLLARMFDAGLMGMLVQEAHGGRGLPMLEYATAVEELARADGSAALVACIHSSLVTALLAEFASDAQKERWLRPLATRSVGAFALTEADPASPTRADERDGAFVVAGSKNYITNAPVADLVLVFARHGEDEVGLVEGSALEGARPVPRDVHLVGARHLPGKPGRRRPAEAGRARRGDPDGRRVRGNERLQDALGEGTPAGVARAHHENTERHRTPAAVVGTLRV